MSPEVEVRLLRPDDIDQIVAIDAKITGQARPEYYRHKLQASTLHEAQISTSLVAVADGKVIGFLMGTLFFGDFGIPESSAVVDTLGVDPAHQDRGAGGALFAQFLANMKAAGVEKIYTLVDWRDFGMLKFFGHMGFVPSQRLNLECPVR